MKLRVETNREQDTASEDQAAAERTRQLQELRRKLTNSR
jgi:hypothetical protein